MCLLNYDKVNYKTKKGYKIVRKYKDKLEPMLYWDTNNIEFIPNKQVNGAKCDDEYHNNRICFFKNKNFALLFATEEQEVWECIGYDVEYEGKWANLHSSLSYMARSIKLIKKVS